jgi:hypothetical protein
MQKFLDIKCWSADGSKMLLFLVFQAEIAIMWFFFCFTCKKNIQLSTDNLIW